MEAGNPSNERTLHLSNANNSMSGVNFDDVQPIDYSALFRCVARLFEDGQTSHVIRDMIDTSTINKSAESAASDCIMAAPPPSPLAATTIINQTTTRPQMATINSQQSTATTPTTILNNNSSSSQPQCLSFKSLSMELANHLFNHQVQQDYLNQLNQQPKRQLPHHQATQAHQAPHLQTDAYSTTSSSPSTATATTAATTTSQAPTTTTGSTTSTASGQQNLFGVLDELDNFSQVNWTSLGHKLPAFESSIKLEILEADWQLYLTIIYTLTAVTSFILNVVTVIVLTRSRRSELRKYLINLSVSDLLMSLFSIPFTYTEYMFGRWIFPAFLCPVVRFVVTLSVFVSVATMTVIGINRHLAIMYPLKRKKYSKFKRWSVRQSHVILLIWLVGIAFSLPEYFMFRAEPFCYNHQLVYDCRHSSEDALSNSYTVFIYMSTFAIPLSLLSYLYTSIGLKLWHRQMPGNVHVNRDLTMQNKRAKVVKMLFVVVLLFAVFWLPLQTFSLVLFLFPELRKGFVYQSVQYNIFIAAYFACHWLSMAHSCLNPLIYCFMNEKFRSELYALICRRKGDRQHQLVETYSAPPTAATAAAAAAAAMAATAAAASARNHHSFKNNKPQAQQQHQHQPLTTTATTSIRLERTSSTLDNNQDYMTPTPTTTTTTTTSGSPQRQRPRQTPEDEWLDKEPPSTTTTGGAQQQLNGPHKMLKLVNNIANNTSNSRRHHCRHYNYNQTHVDSNSETDEPSSSASLVECTLLKLAVTTTTTTTTKGNGCHGGQLINRAASQVETLTEEEEEEDEDDDEHNQDDYGKRISLQRQPVDMVVVVASLGHRSMGTDRQIL